MDDLMRDAAYGAQSKRAIMEFSHSLSKPLKKMKAEVLNNWQTCYKEEHLSDTFTNTEQIDICKQEKYDEVFNKFDQMIMDHRGNDEIKLNNCVDDANDDPMFAIRCLEQHTKNVRSTNAIMTAQFKQDYKNFV